MTQEVKRFQANKFVKVLYWLCVAAGIWFAFLNINPYAQAVKLVIRNSTSDSSLVQIIAMIPIVNGFAALLGSAMHWLIGLILWGIIQTIEVFPILLKRDRAFMRVIINENQGAEKFKVDAKDDPALAALKTWYNRFPTLTMNNARNLALFTYAIDFLICTVVYPPCKGGFGQLMFILVSGDWTRLDWGNIALLMITLFAIEIIINLLFWFSETMYFMRIAHTRNG
jgi:hypothetical protein